jgi:nicotinamidase-related amidase
VISCFFCVPRALSVLSEIFFQNAGADGDPPGLAKGTRWDGMPYHVTLGHPGWWVTSEQVEARSVFFPLNFRSFFFVGCYF